jgi:hypothetical protein
VGPPPAYMVYLRFRGCVRVAASPGGGRATEPSTNAAPNHNGPHLSDSVVPMFVTVQLREGEQEMDAQEEQGGEKGEEVGVAATATGTGASGLGRSRRRIVLWPRKGNDCPVKGRV